MLQAKHKTGLVFFPAFDWAISPTHPEREERLLYTQDQVFEEGLFDIDGVTELNRTGYLKRHSASTFLRTGRLECCHRIPFHQCRWCQNHRHGGTRWTD
jgi:hypothetical protein